ncbi:phosphatase PAP2 family protein [Lysobacter tyrosinilyticus]
MPDGASQRDGVTAALAVPFRIRLLAVTTMVTVNTLIYLLINANPTRTPALLPVTWLDHALGRHAWTIWPYWLLLVINPFFAVAIRERTILLASLRAYVAAMGLNIVVWLAWPTRILRETLPQGMDSLTQGAWNLLYALDAPNNCFPSGHITIPCVVMAGFVAQYPDARRWIWIVALLFPAIITTGQHYAIDLFAGMLTAVAGIALAGLPALMRLRRPAIA